MRNKKNVSRVKISLGYALMLAVLLFSLFFVNREMGNLTLSTDRDMQWEDSLMTLLREKDNNTIRLLRMLSAASDSLMSTNDIEQVIAQHDTIIIRQRVQQHVVKRQDTIRTPKKEKKSFFRRLGEAFVPPKEDTTIQVRTTTEVAMDTVYDTYNPVDSLQERLKAVTQKRQERQVGLQQRQRYLRRLDKMLNARIDSLLKGYEREMLRVARETDIKQEQMRQHSARIIGGIAVGAVLLAAFFLVLIGRDVTRSNRYRRELEEARRRAEELLATREKLMLAITHDFKAPLGSIMGYADLLSRLTVDERQRFYLDNMKTSSEHLLKLVVDLLDFHRLDLHKAEVNRVSFHPARLLEEIRVSFEPLTAAKGLALHCETAPELEGTYICDPLRLRQIINNLLSNAVKFTEKGSITLSARYEERRLVVIRPGALHRTHAGAAAGGRNRSGQQARQGKHLHATCAYLSCTDRQQRGKHPHPNRGTNRDDGRKSCHDNETGGADRRRPHPADLDGGHAETGRPGGSLLPTGGRAARRPAYTRLRRAADGRTDAGHQRIRPAEPATGIEHPAGTHHPHHSRHSPQRHAARGIRGTWICRLPAQALYRGRTAGRTGAGTTEGRRA